MPSLAELQVLDADTMAICEHFRSEVVTPYDWTRAENQAGTYGEMVSGEAGGYFVTSTSIRRRAYLKPTKRDMVPSRERAAREKIAADLAWEAGVCVPPVSLFRRSAPGADGTETRTCVSLVLFPMQFSWAQTQDLIGNTSTAAVLRDRLTELLQLQSSSALAFDTWVCQGDHGDHPHNIVFGFAPDAVARSSFVFLDYAMSLGFAGTWSGGKFAQIGRVPFPRRMLAAVSDRAVSEAVAQIEDLDEELVREVVMRIPDDYLVTSQKETIFTGLLYRKSRLRELVQQEVGQ